MVEHLAGDGLLQSLVVDHWTTSRGLPTNSVIHSEQTSDGFLWLTTFAGVVRFDGASFETFDRQAIERLASEGETLELRGNGFHRVFEDARGRVLIATQGSGVLVYENGRFRSLHQQPFERTVRALFVDSSGAVWIGTNDHGLYRHEGARTMPIMEDDLQQTTVRHLLEDQSGALWIATEGKGVSRMHGGRTTTFTTSEGLVSNAVATLFEHGDSIWAGTQDGLSRIREDRIETFDSTLGLEITEIETAGANALLLGAEQGLFRLDIETGKLDQPVKGLDSNLGSVSGLTVDHEGSLWLASYGRGLFRVRLAKLGSLTTASGLSSERTNFVYEMADGRILLGSDHGAIDLVETGEALAVGPDVASDSRKNLGPVQRLDLRTNVGDVRMRTALEEDDGTLWIGSYGGLVRKRGAQETHFTVDTGLPTNQIRKLHQDASGNLWVATRNAGLLRYDGKGGFDTLDQEDGLNSAFIFSITDDGNGGLLVGTYEGLNRLRSNGDIEVFSSDQGLPGSIVFNIRDDGEGGFWLATNGGLGHFDQGKISSISEEQGLPVDSVFDARSDSHGNLWLSSSVGLIRVSRSQLMAVLDGAETSLDATVFDESDGLANRECTGATGMLVDSSGRIWVPTLGGVSVADAANLSTNTVAPPVVIREVSVDGKLMLLDGQTLTLPPGSRQLAFRFAALSLISAKDVEVLYRLDGFDDDWTDAGAERSVRYTSLPPKDYRFRVIAANNDGVWNRSGASVDLELRPFFYQRTPVIVLTLALAAAIVFQLSRRGLRAVHDRNAFLEQVVSELERKNAEMERFTYTVSHDLRSPLVTVLGYLGAIRRDIGRGKTGRALDDIGRVQRAASSMSSLLDDLLELSRIGRVEGKVARCSMSEVAASGRERVEGLVGDSEITIRTDMPEELIDRDRMIEVYQNLMENALKFTQPGQKARIAVGMEERSGQRVYTVRDSGIGVEKQYRERIFDLFERLEPSIPGTGAGLAIVKRVIETHRGRIWVESPATGPGSVFCFTLEPTDSAAERALEISSPAQSSPSSDGERGSHEQRETFL